MEQQNIEHIFYKIRNELINNAYIYMILNKIELLFQNNKWIIEIYFYVCRKRQLNCRNFKIRVKLNSLII